MVYLDFWFWYSVLVNYNMIRALNRTTNPIGRTSAIPHHNWLPAYLIDCSCHHDITESINQLLSNQYTTVLIPDARFVLFWDDIEEAKRFAYFGCFNVSHTSERWMPSEVWLQRRLLCGQMPENGDASSVQLRPKGQNTVSVFNSVVHFLASFAESQ